MLKNCLPWQDHQRAELESEREQILHRFALEKEDMQQAYAKLQEQMEDAVSGLTRDRDNSLLMAENDRQQVGLFVGLRPFLVLTV